MDADIHIFKPRPRDNPIMHSACLSIDFSVVICGDIGRYRCIMGSQRYYNLKEAASQIGVSSITLRRWLLSRKVGEVHRDRNGWRVFTLGDIARIKQFAFKLIPPKKR